MQLDQGMPALTPKMARHLSMLAKGAPRNHMDGRTLNALARRDMAKKLKRGDWKLLASGRRLLK